MAEPFLAEIKMVGFTFAPRGWALCDGQILEINQNQSLYSLLGTTYGGDGRTSFALPDLRSRVPMHRGNSITLGQRGGAETVTLTVAEMGSHNHVAQGSTNGAEDESPVGNLLPQTEVNSYKVPPSTPPTLVSMKPSGNTGGGQAHNNMQPYLTISFCIALRGLFPSRN